MSRPRAIVLLSGGLDSTTLVYLLALADHAGVSHHPQQDQPSAVRGTYGLAREGYDLHALSFDYGQRHKKELAYAAAVSEQAEIVTMAAHAGDHAIYPDCRPGFIAAFAAMQRLAVEGFGHPHLRLVAPFLHSTKQDIVTVGARLGVRFVDTWSCYKGGEQHCGTCGTCDERRRSFELAGVPDPTTYVSPLSCDGETPEVAPGS